jgi:hypothetical protein
MNDSLTPTPRGWHPCVNGRYPTLQPAEEPEPLQVPAEPPEVSAEPPDPPQDGEGDRPQGGGGASPSGAAPAESPLHHPADGPPPRAGEDQETAQENPVPQQVAAWVNRHWDLVKAMACAEETPQRPPPPPEEAEVSAQPGPAEPRPMPRVDVPRGDRWDKPMMVDFLRMLAATHSVSEAARSVGMSRQSAHKLRNRLKGQPFDIAWEAAFRHGYDNLAHAALELALEGEEVPHYHQGELVATHRKRYPHLMVSLLKMRNRVGVPMLGRYGAAAEYYGERWDALLERVRTGSADWSDEYEALGEDGLKRANVPDQEREMNLIEQRNRPDEGPKRRDE